jgi:hypothetical protein
MDEHENVVPSNLYFFHPTGKNAVPLQLFKLSSAVAAVETGI